METEYLITFDSESATCTSVEKFKNLLSVHESISFKQKSTIKFKNSEFKYKLARGNLTDNSYYYDLTIIESKEPHQSSYIELLKAIRKVCHDFSKRNIIILHDGVGEYYSQQGYPAIYRAENLMRKLISKFMAISIGYDWSSSTTPKEVLDSVRGVKGENANFLLKVDFIQLSNFLFKEYSKSDSQRFIESLKEKSPNEDVKISDLTKYIPVTNWEKYFSEKVDCSSEYIQKRWNRLYEIRCTIAHCRGLKESEYKELTEKSKEVCEKIQSALNSIGDIHIEQEEREELAENLSGAANEKIADFINKYNKLSRSIQKTCEESSSPDDIYYKSTANEKNIRMQARYLYLTKKLINEEHFEKIINSQTFRNKLVHQSGIIDINKTELDTNIVNIKTILNHIESLDQEEINQLKGKDYRDELEKNISSSDYFKSH